MIYQYFLLCKYVYRWYDNLMKKIIKNIWKSTEEFYYGVN